MSAPESGLRGPIGKRVTFAQVARVVFGFWAFEAALALFMAFPVHAAIERAYGSHPEGDAVLFHPGSLELMELVYRFDLSASMIPVLLGLAMCVAAVLGHLPLAAALVSLGAHGTRAVWSRAVSAFPRMLIVFALSLFVRGLIAIAAVWTAFHVENAFAASSGEMASYVWALSSLIPFALVFSAISVLLDYVYAGVANERGLVRPVGDALVAFRSRALASILNWLARNVASLLVLLVGAVAARAFGGSGGATLFLLFVIHQLVELTRIFLRVNWLSYVIRSSSLSQLLS